jgi:hypothetical protein
LCFDAGRKVMASLVHLREPLGAVLRERPDWYWLAYQVYERLVEVDPATVDLLRQEFGNAVGKGGGHHFGPAVAIAQCLGTWPECVDVKHINARGLRINEIEASGEEKGIFRWLNA